MTKEEEYRQILGQYYNQRPGLFGASYAGSYRNANEQLKRWNEWWENTVDSPNISKEEYEENVGGLKAQRGSALAGGIVAGLTGATSLLSNAYKDAQIRDTTMQEGVIANLRNAGNYNYNDYEQLANDYARTDFSPNFNYQDIRGMTKGQQIGSVATSALSGAMTGLQIGGPWGALAGLAVGGLTGLAGVATGNAAARVKQDSLNLQASLASDAAQQNFGAAHERISASKARQGIVNSVASGGNIQRRSQNIREYANKVLKKTGNNARNCGGKIVRVRKEGGVCVRIKY